MPSRVEAVRNVKEKKVKKKKTFEIKIQIFFSAYRVFVLALNIQVLTLTFFGETMFKVIHYLFT